MYLVHGLTRSYFTRKVTGYLDYTERPWRLTPMGPEPAGHPSAAAADKAATTSRRFSHNDFCSTCRACIPSGVM